MEKPIIVELVRVYKESESPLEKANIWSHIVAEIEEIAYKNNSDNDYSTSLYWTEDDERALSDEREAYKRGYIQAINDLIFN